MNKYKNILIWSVAAILVIAALYTVYSKNKNTSNLKQDITVRDSSSTIAAKDSTGTNSVNSGTSQQESTAKKIFLPDFSAKDLDGNTVSPKDYKGKIIILNFWATWCTYCKQEMPDLNELSKELDKKNDAIILAVDSQESAKTVKNFVSSNKLDLKVLLDEDGSITSAFSKYGLEGYPTTYVLNTDGSLYTYIPGATTKDVLLEILEKIRNGKPLK